MREVKRYCLSEFAEPNTYPVGPGSYVATEEYDALHAEAEEWKRRCQYNADTAHDVARERDRLHAEAEALQRKVTELTNQRDAILLQARCWAGEAKTQQSITKAVGEALGGVPNWGPIVAVVEALRAENGRLKSACDHNKTCAQVANELADQLSTQLEAARGLLREVRQRCQLPDWARSQIDKLTATPATEVPDHTERNLEMAEQGAITVERDFVGTMHIKVGDFDAVQVRYQYPYTDNASTRRLAERIADMLRNPQAEQGERQEAVSTDAIRKRFSEIEDEVARGKHNAMSCFTAMRTAALYTPQPGPDVRGLVRAGQQMANSCYNLSQFEIIGDANVKAQLRELAKGWDEALAAHHQAQRQA